MDRFKVQHFKFFIILLTLLGMPKSVTLAGGYYNVGGWFRGFTLSYDGNGQTGGTVPAPTNVTPKTAVTVASNSGSLTRTGHSFAGWNTQADGTGFHYAAGSSSITLSAANMTLYAQWAVNSYTVSYNGNGNTSGTTPASANYNYNTNVTVAGNTGGLARAGYTFGGWNTQADGNGSNYTAGSGSFTMGEANVTLYAKWTMNSYTVSYNGNGNTSGTVPASANYNYNTTVTVAGNTGSLARTGYTFAGWNTQADGNGSNYAAGSGSFTMSAANVTLYAKWTINAYTLSYNGNGNTSGSAPASANYNYNTSVTVAGNTGSLTRTGYSFAGWNTQADGNGSNYAAGSGSFTMGAANLTLYARWTINSYTVSYNGNGNTGGSVPFSANYNYNTTVTVAGNTGSLARTGYSFAGWNTQADGNGSNYAAGSGSFTMGAASVTLYARWTVNSYTVAYDGNGNTGGSVPASANYNYNTTVTVAENTGSLARTGYTFAGWNTQADGNGSNYTAGSGSFTMGAANVTLYAKWTLNSFTVSYNGNSNTSGSVPASANYTSNTTVTVAGNTGSLIRNGFTFAGWNTAANGSGTNYSAGQTFSMPSNNIILYARWNAITPNYGVVLTGGSSFTVPEGYSSVKAWAIGGGGGGAGAYSDNRGAGGGGGGGVAFRTFTVTGGTVVYYSIGGGGTAGYNSGSGGAGGQTSVTVNSITIYGNGGNGGCWNQGCTPWGGGYSGGDGGSDGGTGGVGCYNQDCGSGSGGAIGGISGSWGTSTAGYFGANSADISGLFSVLSAAGYATTSGGAGGATGSSGTKNQNHGGNASGFGCGGGSAGYWGGNGGNGRFGGGGGGGNGENAATFGGSGGQGAVVLLLN